MSGEKQVPIVLTAVEAFKGTKEDAIKAWAHVVEVTEGIDGFRRFQSSVDQDGTEAYITDVFESPATLLKVFGTIDTAILMSAIEFKEVKIVCSSAQLKELGNALDGFGAALKVYLTDGCPGHNSI